MRKILILVAIVAVAGCASPRSSAGAPDYGYYGYSTRTYYDPWHSPYREDQGPGHSIPLMR